MDRRRSGCSALSFLTAGFQHFAIELVDPERDPFFGQKPADGSRIIGQPEGQSGFGIAGGRGKIRTPFHMIHQVGIEGEDDMVVAAIIIRFRQGGNLDPGPV